MTFRDDINQFKRKVKAESQALFVNVVSHAHESIVNGSPVTGAPGQPVDTGNLRDSWQIMWEAATRALIVTNVSYARIVEDNLRGVTFKNHGPHSVKLTIAGLARIVAAERARMAA